MRASQAGDGFASVGASIGGRVGSAASHRRSRARPGASLALRGEVERWGRVALKVRRGGLGSEQKPGTPAPWQRVLPNRQSELEGAVGTSLMSPLVPCVYQ